MVRADKGGLQVVREDTGGLQAVWEGLEEAENSPEGPSADVVVAEVHADMARGVGEGEEQKTTLLLVSQQNE